MDAASQLLEIIALALSSWRDDDEDDVNVVGFVATAEEEAADLFPPPRTNNPNADDDDVDPAARLPTLTLLPPLSLPTTTMTRPATEAGWVANAAALERSKKQIIRRLGFILILYSTSLYPFIMLLFAVELPNNLNGTRGAAGEMFFSWSSMIDDVDVEHVVVPGAVCPVIVVVSAIVTCLFKSGKIQRYIYLPYLRTISLSRI